MSIKNLSRRLEQLEVLLRPADDPLIIQLCYVSSDGSVVDGPQYRVPCGLGRQGRRAWFAGGGRPGFAGGETHHRGSEEALG